MKEYARTLSAAALSGQASSAKEKERDASWITRFQQLK